MSKFNKGDKVVKVDGSTFPGGVLSVTVYTTDEEGNVLFLNQYGWVAEHKLKLAITPQKHCELIKAWADGATIECRNNVSGKWNVVPSPMWTYNAKYRIKPDNPNADAIERIEKEMRKLADELAKLKTGEK